MPSATVSPPASGTARPWSHRRRRLPLVVAVVGVLLQVPYPLLDGEPLRLLTIGVVVVLALAALTHAAVTGGLRTAATVLVVVGGLSLVAEAVGVATGYPFGRYSYAGTLGPELLGVPVVVPLAWTMLTYPLLLAARAACGRRRWLVVPAAALALVGWDLYLDPQMVDAGHWTWAFPAPHLPGVDGIPLTNAAGWAVVGLVVVAVLDRVLPDRTSDHPAGPALVVGWTWLGSALALAVWLDRPGAALWGLVVMAPVVVPALVRWVRR